MRILIDLEVFRSGNLSVTSHLHCSFVDFAVRMDYVLLVVHRPEMNSVIILTNITLTN